MKLAFKMSLQRTDRQRIIVGHTLCRIEHGYVFGTISSCYDNENDNDIVFVQRHIQIVVDVTIASTY